MRNRRASAPTFGKPVRLARSVPGASSKVYLGINNKQMAVVNSLNCTFYPAILIKSKKSAYQQESELYAD